MVSLSVIIPTRGRDACVRQTLKDLAGQDFSDFDVWLVDQNDKSLENLADEAPGLRLHHEQMPPLGSHAGRNHAILKTSAPICVFVDDDVRIPAGFLKAHHKALSATSSKIAAVAGRVIQPKDGFSETEMRQMGRPARYNRFAGQVSGNFVGFESCPAEHVHECNFSARTAALRAIGGFNEEFQGNAYFEGADLALRLIEAGYQLVYEPSIVLTHLQESAGGNRVADKARHTYWYMRNYGLLNSLHMNPLGLPIFSTFGVAYVLGKAAKNFAPEIARQGLRGLVDGLKYFKPGIVRMKSRR